MIALLTALSVAAANPVLVIESGSGSSVGCSAADGLRERITTRLPDVELHERASGADDLSITFEGGPETWTLTIRRRDGSIAMVRAIAMPSGGCSALADAGALIVDRFLHDLRWPGLPVRIARQPVVDSPPVNLVDASPAPLPPEPPPPVALAPAASSAPSAPSEPEASEAPPWISGIGGGAALAVRIPAIGGPQMGGRLWFEIASSSGVRGALAVHAYAPNDVPVVLKDRLLDDPVRLGTLRTQAGMSMVSIGYCWLGDLSVCADAGAGVSWTVISPGADSSTDRLYGESEQAVVRAIAGGGFEIGYELPWLGIQARAGAGVWGRIEPARFFVDGIVDAAGDPEPVFESPPFELAVAMGIAKLF